MKHTRLRQIAMLAFFICTATSYAQENTVASGGSTTNSNGSISYSVGQVFYTSESGTDGSITQGVQQSYSISVVTSTIKKSISCTAFPNPATNYIKVKITDNSSASYTAFLYDENGKQLSVKQIESNEATFTMSELPANIYFIKVYDKNKKEKVFKVVKN